MAANASPDRPGQLGGRPGFSKNASIRWPSGAVCTTPKSVACVLGTGIAATVAPAPQARCASIICLGSILYMWSAPSTARSSGRSAETTFSDW